MRNAERVRELEEVAHELRRSGDANLAEKVHRVIDDLKEEKSRQADDLMTTGEAAEVYGQSTP